MLYHVGFSMAASLLQREGVTEREGPSLGGGMTSFCHAGHTDQPCFCVGRDPTLVIPGGGIIGAIWRPAATVFPSHSPLLSQGYPVSPLLTLGLSLRPLLQETSRK